MVAAARVLTEMVEETKQQEEVIFEYAEDDGDVSFLRALKYHLPCIFTVDPKDTSDTSMIQIGIQ